MKILFITPHYEPAWQLGGIVQSVSLLSKYLSKKGHEVTVFTTDSAKYHRMEVPLNKETDIDGVKVFYFKTDFSVKFAYSWFLKKACRDMLREYDIIHLSSIWHYPEYPGSYFARKYDIPYVVKVAGGLRSYGLQKSRFKKMLYLNLIEYPALYNARAIHYTSLLEREDTPSRISHLPSFIFGNGINVEEFHNASPKAEAREYFNIPAGAFVGVFLGRIDKIKNLANLVKALAIIRKFGIDGYLVIGGPDFGGQQEIESLVADLRLDNHINFLGYVDPKIRNILYAAADFIALPSFQENFGNVAVEGMAAGRPVIISNQVGIVRAIENDMAGIVVETDAGSIANGIKKLALDPGMCLKLGENAYNSAKRRYDLESVGRKCELAFWDILHGTQSPELLWSNR